MKIISKSAQRIRRVLNLVCTLFAARGKKLVIITSHTNRLAGNALGFAVVIHKSSDFKVVFLTRDTAPSAMAEKLKIDTHVKDGRIGRYLWRRADLIIHTSWMGYLEDMPQDTKAFIVNLWHGMPIKAIGVFEDSDYVKGIGMDVGIATSPFTAKIISDSFMCPLSEILISGEPKTDILPFGADDGAWLASLKNSYRRIIAFCPTWRESLDEKIGTRSRERKNDAIAQLVQQMMDDEDLRRVLREQDAAMVIRIHPFSNVASLPIEPPFYLMDESMGEASHLLEAAHVYIGDYSSLDIDALLFQIPMALWCEDLDAYCRVRKMPYFSFEETFAWCIYRTLPEIIQWLEDRLQGRPLPTATEEAYLQCRTRFHSRERGGAGKRIFDAVQMRMKAAREGSISHSSESPPP